MTDPIATLAQHVACTLPDSLSRRKAVLLALRAVMKSSHPACNDINHQIKALAAIEQLQAELPLHFKKTEAA